MLDVALLAAQTPSKSVTEVSLWEIVGHSGPLVLSILLLLIGFSVASWAIIAYKWWVVRNAILRSEAFLDAFWASKRLDGIYAQLETFAGSPVAAVFRAGYVELMRFLPKAGERDSERDLSGGPENVERALRRATSAQLTALESLIPMLATTGSTAPFIGVLGTVLGIMKSFHEIGAAGAASLATVAPGISEALIATAAGLFAAIPAVIAYNYFTAKLRVVGAEMEHFSADFMNIVRRHLRA